MKSKPSYLIWRPEWLLIASLFLTACGGGGNKNTKTASSVTSSSLSFVSSVSTTSATTSSSATTTSSSATTTSSSVDTTSSSLSNSSTSSSSSTDSGIPNVELSFSATNITFVSLYRAEALATDNMGITKVEFYVGESLYRTDTTSPYMYDFTPTWEDNGTYVYTAKAYDADGNVKTSNAVSVKINIPIQDPIQESLTINGPTRVIANTLTRYYTSSNYAINLQWEWFDGDAMTEGFNVSKGWRVPTADAFVSAEFGEPGDPIESEGSLTGIYVIGTPLASGMAHSCALKPDGSIMCWGNNFYGSLGNDSTTNATSPVYVFGISDAKAVGVGNEHSCAIKSNNRVACWGKNDEGQLGNNSLDNSSTPVEVKSLINVQSLGVGATHNCAVTSDLKVKCWGDNSYGQLGNTAIGTSEDSLLPLEVNNFNDAMTVAAGKYNSCAIKRGGSVWCWGHGFFGQLGDGKSNVVQSVTPVQVTGITNAISISVGDRFACALTADGKAWCWGRNQYGQLGNNSTLDSSIPVEVQGATGNSIAAGANHACLTSLTGVYCWGASGWGNMGNGSSLSSLVPVSTAGLGNLAAYIGVGEDHTCTLLRDGAIKCWGYDGSGRLGDGDATSSSSPVPVNVSSGAVFWK